MLPVGAFALLRVMEASLSVIIGGLQVAVLAAYVLMTARATSRGAATLERLADTVAVAVWRAVDLALIDGIFNGIGLVVRGWSATLRRAQSDSVRVHALSMLAGVVAMLGYFLWR